MQYLTHRNKIFSEAEATEKQSQKTELLFVKMFFVYFSVSFSI